MKEEDIVGRTFLQNSGESILVLEKTKIKNPSNKGALFYIIQYLKYPFVELRTKRDILRGSCVNPLIEKYEFIGKYFEQHCGDVCIVLEKTEKREILSNGKLGNFLYKIQFKKFPYIDYRTKENIINGKCKNPKIEENFLNQEWFQHCGDIIYIIKETNEYKGKAKLYEVGYKIYPHKEKRTKYDIISGKCYNPNLPWRSKEGLLKYIKENFNHKPTLKELSIKIKNSKICIYINKFNLREYINYSCKGEENLIKEFVKSIYKDEIITYHGTKKEKYREIDIYLPKIKKGIEYNGSFWHEEGNLNNKFSREIGYHKEKEEIFKHKGIKILNIWDKEWYRDYPKNTIINEECKERIKDFILN